ARSGAIQSRSVSATSHLTHNDAANKNVTNATGIDRRANNVSIRDRDVQGAQTRELASFTVARVTGLVETGWSRFSNKEFRKNLDSLISAIDRDFGFPLYSKRLKVMRRQLARRDYRWPVNGALFLLELR